MVFLVFQSLGAKASKPNTGGNEYNFALASNGGSTNASGYYVTNTADRAIDGDTLTYWQSSTTTGWLAVKFASVASVNEVHAHFLTTKYTSMSLYLDTNANLGYEPTEKVCSTTANGGLDVIIPTLTTSALGMKLTIDAKVGSNKPTIAEFEAHLKYDTDGDGLADGQELFVKSVKTPKRTPLPDQRWTYSDPMTFPSGGPAWAVASAMLMTGFTHPDMGQVEARLVDNAPAPYGRSVVLRAYANAGQANNFSSYDLANLGYPRDELILGGPWYAYAYDRTAGRTGQIDYAQIQLTMHTLPNRADTDADGLNDSEEVNLASDGFATDPWQPDSDADGLADGLESNGWSRSGGSIVADPNGFHTDPTSSR